MSDIVYCKDCAYAEPNNLTAYETVKLGVFCKRYRQNTAGIYGCDNGKPKPKTNADRIRAMSDEELADWLIMNGDGSDYETWLAWLKRRLKHECKNRMVWRENSKSNGFLLQHLRSSILRHLRWVRNAGGCACEV